MFCCKFCLICVVIIILCIHLCVGSSRTKKCVETEKQALLKLKHGFRFIDGRDILSSWNSEDCCKWKGISCNNLTGHVTRLELQFSKFSPVLGAEDLKDLPDWTELVIINDSATLMGKIDSSICELQYLTLLDLSNNFLEGEIPKCIGSLGQLVELKLAQNELVGSVPRTLANLSNLQSLDLRENNLVSNDLEWLSHLSNLRYLGLSSIDLSKAVDWLSSISKLPYLLELYFNNCGLPQVNPKTITYMNSSTSLQILSLQGNQLNSSILSWVLNVSKDLRALDLSSNSLYSVPDGFANMISLQYLDLSYNELDGSVIKLFKTLCLVLEHLKFFSLEQNSFSRGPLPDFSKLSSLNILFLGNTNIVGPLSFGHLPHLEYLDLSFNHLNGSFPIFDVTKFASLKYLDLSHNELSGTLPYTIGQLSNLTTLSLSSNQLNGTISEAHLLTLSRLDTLDVSQNSLHFHLNPNWVPPFQLQLLYASSCILGPQFPTWLKHQRKLMILEISNTGIIDSFPTWFWDISSSLSYLNISHNELSGVLPKSLSSEITELQSMWDFSFNNLSGPLPPFLQKLEGLFLSNNMFSGSVSSFCTMSPVYLIYLDLSSNLLAGSLPNCWQKFQRLKVLNLANNSLSGKIPKSFGTLSQIESMHLNNNNFSGEIPHLTLCRSLRFIDFGDNILEGTLPTWLGHNLHNLIVLRLRANKIQGNIPTSVCNLSFLQILDLSTNNISGELPQCLSHITAMSNKKFPRHTIFYDTTGHIILNNSSRTYFVDETILVWKGENRDYGKILGLMTMIDLSSNHLTGEIPQSLTALVALASLNLSGNNLSGFIPNNIGDMEMLESLDLSRNHLHGRMPQSFSKLSFLDYMNLSFNNLSGEIPVSTQLQSFDPSAYIGNIGLCGPPLTNQCPLDVIPPSGTVDKNGTDEDELVNFGFYVSLGLGFCVGFWGIIGSLIFKSSWRHAYYQFLNNIYDWIYVTVVVFVATMKRRFQSQYYTEGVGSLVIAS